MKVESVRQQGNTLQATFSVTSPDPNNDNVTKQSPRYKICGVAVFHVCMDIMRLSNGSWKTYIFITFYNLQKEDDLTYTIRLSSNKLEIVNKNFISDDGTWHYIYESMKIEESFDVTVHMDTVPTASPFAMLHEDTELTNFVLRGEDGSVCVHRAVLAAASPVFRRMLSGTWHEATEGRVEVPGTSKVTLQNLKDYVYLHTLPDNGLEPLLLLASCYMMKDLEQNCINKIASSVTAENACDLLDFAIKHKVPLLLLAIFECFNEKSKLDELVSVTLAGK